MIADFFFLFCQSVLVESTAVRKYAEKVHYSVPRRVRLRRGGLSPCLVWSRSSFLYCATDSVSQNSYALHQCRVVQIVNSQEKMGQLTDFICGFAVL